LRALRFVILSVAKNLYLPPLGDCFVAQIAPRNDD